MSRQLTAREYAAAAAAWDAAEADKPKWRLRGHAEALAEYDGGLFVHTCQMNRDELLTFVRWLIQTWEFDPAEIVE